MIVNTLKEFIESRGFGMEAGPYTWARAFYKYTDCGPWTAFIIPGGSIYYEDAKMKEWPQWVDKCIGIKVGSIVEGSEASYGPKKFMFPFDTVDFDTMCAEMERYTSEEWERANGEPEEVT